ncbi:unnamed protein product [Calypogeia fissa]
MPSVEASVKDLCSEEVVSAADDTKEGDGDGERAAKRQCRSPVVCEECGEREAKYRCPGCGLRSCGLLCVKSHKERTQCTGKRNRTAFVPVSDFDENWLISDYNFLEETLRQTDSAKRLRAPLGGNGGGGGGKSELHPALKALQRQAKSRSTSLLFVAQGMSKRKVNTSFYERKTKRIFWRVEWMFEGTDVWLKDPRVDENMSLENILAKHLSSDSGDVMVKHRLRSFCKTPFNELKLLLSKDHCPAPEKGFYELNLKESLRDQLVNKTVIEYPVINVVLPRDASKFVMLASETKPLPKAMDVDQADGPVTPTPRKPEGFPVREEEMEEKEPEGVPFREEEIEEGEFVQ